MVAEIQESQTSIKRKYDISFFFSKLKALFFTDYFQVYDSNKMNFLEIYYDMNANLHYKVTSLHISFQLNSGKEFAKRNPQSNGF